MESDESNLESERNTEEFSEESDDEQVEDDLEIMESVLLTILFPSPYSSQILTGVWWFSANVVHKQNQ